MPRRLNLHQCLFALVIPLASHAAEDDPAVQLNAICLADQADRDSKNPDWNGRKIDWPAVRARDAVRRAATRALMQTGALHVAHDYYCAAVVFQHGDQVSDFELAHALALISTTLDPAPEAPRYMVAATWDRYLMAMGRPQWYGTQYIRGETGVWTQYTIDKSAVDDESRQRLAVPTLAEALAEIAHLNGDP